MRSMKAPLLVLVVFFLLVATVAGQKGKPWSQWNAKEAQKILNDSGWGQTQTVMNTNEMNFSPGRRPTDSQGAVNQAVGVNFRIRFLSAKPVRQALLRQLQLDPRIAPDQVAQAQKLVDAKYDQVVVIAVSYDQEELPKDSRFTMPVFQAFSGGLTATLQNNVYLDIKGGQRVFLSEYVPDGQMPKFVFPRIVNGKPLLDTKSGEIRFTADFPKLAGNNQQVSLTMRFKVSDMMYDGVVEY